MADGSLLFNLQSPSSLERKRFLFEEASSLCNSLSECVDKISQNALLSLNQKLATGRCFFRDDILFYVSPDGEEQAIYFPNGDALEYQVSKGLLSKEVLDCKIRLENILKSRD
ncbi:hypothetical protein A3715_17570 [Oleiphilus sp. HI0009]|nr:hypothetical protein A3715_17570 [Oleiphilus sp. HI0009]